MKKIGVSSIDKLIMKYVIEMVLVIVLVIASYGSFTQNNLSSAMGIAEDSVNSMRKSQLNYERSRENQMHILNEENVLDEGVLSIKNTNKQDIVVDILLYVSYDEYINRGAYQIGIDGELVELNDSTLVGDYYVLKIASKVVPKYSTIDETVTIYGNPYSAVRLEYTFKTEESFS